MPRLGTATRRAVTRSKGNAVIGSFEDCSLPALVAKRVARQGDRRALSTLDGDRTYTWSELQDAGRSCAAALASCGVRAGDLILLMQANNVDNWVIQLAVATLGAVEVPVNPAYVGAWLTHVIETSRSRVAVVDAAFLDQWTAVLAAHPTLEVVLVVGDEPVRESVVGSTRIVGLAEEVASHGSSTVEPVGLGPRDLATVLWTSGTTGRSKGVLMPWGQWWHRVVTSNFLPDDALHDDDVLFQPWPTFHVGGRQCFYMLAVYGGSAVLRDGFSASGWFEHVQRSEATWTMLIGAATQLIMNTPAVPGEDSTALRFVLSGPASQQSEAMSRRFGIDYYTSYGMTEINNPFRSANYRITEQNWTSCGELNPSRTVRVVDASGEDVGPGEVGELLVLDDRERQGIADGYLGPPELTAASWRNGWFHTGDLFRFDAAGKYYFVDRLKDAIRRGGENISSAEVEAAIDSHPEVAESAVVAVASELAEDEVAAFVRPVSESLTAIDLYGHIERTVPKFARPRYLVLVDDLPRTPSQKIRKVELRDSPLLKSAWDARADREGART